VTTMVRWSPFRELDLMERAMNRMLGMPLQSMLPAADVYETADEFVVELEVPGYEEKELAIEVSDHVLTIKGEHEETTEQEEKEFLLHERLEKEFERRFALPPTVDSAKVKATFKKGLLELHAPKIEKVLPKKIPIG